MTDMRTCLALVLFVLVLPAQASGATIEFDGLSYGLSDETPAETLLIEAQGIARAYWGRDPQCASTWGTLLPPTSTGGSLADERHGFTLGCQAWVDARPTYFPDAFCRTVVHEFGHLIGYADADSQQGDALNVMSETVRPFPPCEVMAYVADQPPARKRTWTRRADRKWCRRHAVKCVAKYRPLARRTLTAERFEWAKARQV